MKMYINMGPSSGPLKQACYDLKNDSNSTDYISVAHEDHFPQ
jgi:hypothetical protein